VYSVYLLVLILYIYIYIYNIYLIVNYFLLKINIFNTELNSGRVQIIVLMIPKHNFKIILFLWYKRYIIIKKIEILFVPLIFNINPFLNYCYLYALGIL